MFYYSLSYYRSLTFAQFSAFLYCYYSLYCSTPHYHQAYKEMAKSIIDKVSDYSLAMLNNSSQMDNLGAVNRPKFNISGSDNDFDLTHNRVTFSGKHGQPTQVITFRFLYKATQTF